MTGMFSRSWEITKISFRIIKEDKKLLMFPILASIFSSIFALAMLFPLIISFFAQIISPRLLFINYFVIFLTYFGLAFIVTFFNYCIIYTLKEGFERKSPSPSKAIKIAFSRIHLILLWSILSASVGLILKILDNIAERMKGAGRVILYIFNSIFGLIWSIATIFVVQGMVFNDFGPIASIKDSVKTLKKTWGESIIRAFGVGASMFVFTIIGFLITILLIMLVSSLGPFAIALVISLAFFYILCLSLLFSVINTIFNTALYIYAKTGKVPKYYNKELMVTAFKRINQS